MPLKQKHKNRLFLIRNKTGLKQKQIAALLGHKTVDQISRYELGAKLPNLETAFKLGIIYNLPIQVLFHGYYEACLKELHDRRENNLKIVENEFGLIGDAASGVTEFCTFEEKLKPFKVAEPELNQVRHHIAELVTVRGEKMKHFTER